MGDNRSSRVESTLITLLDSFIPLQLPGEDEEAYEERSEYALEQGKSIVDQGSTISASEINQAHDLIRRKLLRDNASPEKAARFGNLYSRLLSTPVLNQKWSILYLLYRLAEDESTEYHRAPLSESAQFANILRREQGETLKDFKDLGETRPQHSTIGDGSEVLSNGGQEDTVKPRLRAQQAATPKTNGEEVDGNEDEKAKDYTIDPSEDVLLRDLPFNLQGLSSTPSELHRL